ELDAPIARWLDAHAWFERLPNARELTPRMLLQHTSGLVRYEFDPRFCAALAREPFRRWTSAEQIAFGLDRAAPVAAGAGWEYSDTNYVVLALVLEALTGTDAFDEIERRFLAPLALTHTLRSRGKHIEGLAQGYAAEDDVLLRGGRMLREHGLAFD